MKRFIVKVFFFACFCFIVAALPAYVIDPYNVFHWDNIRNKSKLTNLDFLEETITEFMEEGVVGKYGAEKFSILEEEEKRLRKPLEGSGERIVQECGKVLEVTWGTKDEKESNEHADS